MIRSRGAQKFERVTITLVPTSDEGSFRHIPSTFSPTNRTYGWRHFQQMDYMLVPRKIASNEIKIDIFVDSQRKGKVQATTVQRAVHAFVKSKLHSEWTGLKLSNVGRPTAAAPPDQAFVRGTMEEILGTHLES
jgi:hypothetical protein